MRGRVHHPSTRRAFLLAPLLVAGSAWPAMGAGSVPTYPVPVVIDDTACNPLTLEVGETCGLWMSPTDPAASDFGFANLDLWDVAAGATCTNAGSSSRSDWIANGYPDDRSLNGSPPGSDPAYVCSDSGHSTRDWSDLADVTGQVKLFPVNECAGQLDGAGAPAPCPATAAMFDVTAFARMLILHVYKGNDIAAIGTIGPPPTPGACGSRSADPNAICLVVEFRGEPGTFLPDAKISPSRTAPFSGNDVYGPDPRQVLVREIAPGELERTFLRFENDGTATDTIVVTGAGRKDSLVPRYRSGGVDVTAEVTGTGLEVVLAPGEHVSVRMLLQARPRAVPGTSRRWRLTGASEGALDLADAVLLKVRVVS
jgi:hypothetical protein